ncbi:MAG: RNA polymerase sigma factor [Actinomycetota bacterium]
MSPPRADDLDATADEDLVRLFTDSGDSQALEILLRRHEARVFGLALRILGNRADALDAAQEVFLAVFRRAGSFQHRSAFTTWLYRLTVNACYDLSRSRSRRPVPAGDMPVAAVAASSPDEKVVIEQALSALPGDQRAAVVMRDLYQLSYQEISEATGVPAGTVKSRISRARQALAQKLAADFQGTGQGGPAV